MGDMVKYSPIHQNIQSNGYPKRKALQPRSTLYRTQMPIMKIPAGAVRKPIKSSVADLDFLVGRHDFVFGSLGGSAGCSYEPKRCDEEGNQHEEGHSFFLHKGRVVIHSGRCGTLTSRLAS